MNSTDKGISACVQINPEWKEEFKREILKELLNSDLKLYAAIRTIQEYVVDDLQRRILPLIFDKRIEEIVNQFSGEIAEEAFKRMKKYIEETRADWEEGLRAAEKILREENEDEKTD